jgi:hypothetical protein
MIFLLFFAIAMAANLLFAAPFSIGALAAAKGSSGLWLWQALA